MRICEEISAQKRYRFVIISTHHAFVIFCDNSGLGPRWCRIAENYDPRDTRVGARRWRHPREWLCSNSNATKRASIAFCRNARFMRASVLFILFIELWINGGLYPDQIRVSAKS